MKLVIYSLIEVAGKKALTIGLSERIISTEHNVHIMIDAPVTGLKKFVWYPYMVKHHIFDNGHCFFFIDGYKRANKKWALEYLVKYEADGRKNKKKY